MKGGRSSLQTPSGLISADSGTRVEAAGDGFLWTSAHPEELEFRTQQKVNNMELKGMSPPAAWQGERSCCREHVQYDAASTASLRVVAKSWVELVGRTLQSDTQQLPPLELRISSSLQQITHQKC